MWQTNECECVDKIEICCVTVSNVLFLWRYSFGHFELVAEKGTAGQQFERKGRMELI
jgi:hypothetical protein